jgi:uncharacterized coiled-coil protein SlyX
MTHVPDSTLGKIEKQVTDHLQSILHEYLQMDELVDEMLNLQQQSKPIDIHIDPLRKSRQHILEIEKSATGLMQQYRQSAPHSSHEVNQLIEKTRAKIEKLMLKIATLEQSAKKSYSQLIPEIDHGVRGNQMKQAYGSTPT